MCFVNMYRMMHDCVCVGGGGCIGVVETVQCNRGVICMI